VAGFDQDPAFSRFANLSYSVKTSGSSANNDDINFA
jgi:hypothetical protein